MAFKRVLAILAVIAITLPTIARASEHIVGDDAGWNLNVNYTAWAEGKDFRVGDTLVFRYPVGNHNVFKVNGPDFQACKVPPANESMTTGMDVITLATPGRKWYICGKGDGAHCMKGQKLAITVMPAEWLAPMHARSMAPTGWPASGTPCPSLPEAPPAPTHAPSMAPVGWPARGTASPSLPEAQPAPTHAPSMAPTGWPATGTPCPSLPEAPPAPTHAPSMDPTG